MTDLTWVVGVLVLGSVLVTLWAVFLKYGGGPAPRTHMSSPMWTYTEKTEYPTTPTNPRPTASPPPPVSQPGPSHSHSWVGIGIVTEGATYVIQSCNTVHTSRGCGAVRRKRVPDAWESD